MLCLVELTDRDPPRMGIQRPNRFLDDRNPQTFDIA